MLIHPSVILVQPQMGENIGAAARAMFNFGLTDLRIVNPRDGWPSERADVMSAGALEAMPPVRVFKTLGEAIADLQFVIATTARPREMTKPVFNPLGAATEIAKRMHEGQKTGYVFGAERSGLNNDDVAACHAMLTIPTNPDFSSLNLGQSVLLVAYEWLKANDKTPERVLVTGESFPAAQKDKDEFLTRLETELDSAGFFRDENHKPTMARNIRNLFTRADITDQELRTWHGILTALGGRKKKPL